jgi:hypothetical protein
LRVCFSRRKETVVWPRPPFASLSLTLTFFTQPHHPLHPPHHPAATMVKTYTKRVLNAVTSLKDTVWR